VTKLEMDRLGEFPMDLIRFMLGPEVALHLIFIPEEFGGLGAGAADIAAISEKWRKWTLLWQLLSSPSVSAWILSEWEPRPNKKKNGFEKWPMKP